MAETIPIDSISTEGTQTRAELNQTVIDEYAQAYEQGIELPAVDVYFDGRVYWLADGFHRVKAAQQIGRDSIAANVHPGGQRDAILSGVSSNETHGVRRTNADRRQSVMLMLNDPEWSAWANTEIARQCHVSEFLVRTIRNEITAAQTEPVKERTRQARRGTTTYPMKTGNIGSTKSRRKAADVLKPDIAELQQSSTATPVALVSSMQSKMDHGATDVQFSREPESSMTEHSKSVTVPDQVPAVTPDTPLQSLSTAELDPGPGTSLPLAVSVISAAAAAELSLEDAWEWATQEDRRNFVMQHRDELQKLLKKA